MLSLPSPAQKTVEGEDSSGSDAGSEVGLEPETDRFGFIVTNGSTAGCVVGPAPELVRQREAKWISIMSQWDRILLKKTSKVKVQCQKGIPASLRAKCWPLLCGATDRTKQNDKLYQSLDSHPALQSWVDVIERDLDRQFPFHEMFLSKDGHGQRGLFRVLKAYTQYQPEEGYCQAQGPVAAVLLMNMPAEEAFWCLVQISEQYLPGYYSPLLEGVLFDAAMLTWVLKRTCPAVHKHLQHHGVEPLMFATDWLMCLFTRHLPFNTLLRVWDLFFCHGVRVLLQVAVVLVRRVLGRAEQRRQCDGQMETLERLRGVRDEVQEEDDAFIAEVCSVQLSAKDLEKQTEKQLQKWRKDKPSSTFDPRGRCHGYRMAWARARHKEEEWDKREREKGNLSVPLARSASTLSLSPSLLHRWRKGGKVNAGECEGGGGGGGRVTRHVSMGATEDWRSWSGSHLKKVQGLQEEEDLDSDEDQKQSQPNLNEQTAQKDISEVPENKDKLQNTPTEDVEETVIITEQTEQVETRVNEQEKNQIRETEESQTCSGETEEPPQDPAKDQTDQNIPLPPEHTSHPTQGEELDSDKDQQIVVKDSNEETVKQVAESEQTAAVEGEQTLNQEDADADSNKGVKMEGSADPSEEQIIQADEKPEEGTETEIEQQTQVETVKEVVETTSETCAGSETESGDKDPTVETESQQEQTEVITERTDASEGKYLSSESLGETLAMEEEPHAQAEAETDMLAQTQDRVEENAAMQEKMEAETDSEAHVDSETEAETVSLSSPECITPKEGPDLVAAADPEVEIAGADDIVTDTSSEKECDTVASEPTQEEEETNLTAHSEEQVDNGQTQAEETPIETQTQEEAADLVTPSSQAEEVTLTTEPHAKTCPVEVRTSEEPAPQQPNIQVCVEEEVSTNNVEENTVGEDNVFNSSDKIDLPKADRKPQIQDEDSHSSKDQTEQSDSGPKHIPEHRSSLSSGDLCVRKSPGSRGSWLGRRLSEDLFTIPQSISDHQDVKHADSEPNPGALNPTQPSPHVTSEATEGTPAQQQQSDPPKRFGLLRRLRGEQPNKVKTKMQVPKILIQDFSDGTGTGKPVKEEKEEKLSSRERRRRRRERERKEKEEEKLRKKREKELEKERRKPQTRGKSFQVQKEKGSSDVPQPAKTGSQTLRSSETYAESYF
uniref:ecotropic viral integration site 5 ortholog n=1 Tax=Semicossyphus pulcher TaxID=241346 RepID=UPI0037E758F1